MRIKMRSLVSFLGFAVGIFMLGDIFIFSSVGRHSGQSRAVSDSPYRLTKGRFMKRQIKSGTEYLSDGVRQFADRLYDGSDESSTGYDGVRDSVLGAMEVPGMKQKILPVDRKNDLERLGLSGDVYNIRQLEEDLIAGRLWEEDDDTDVGLPQDDFRDQSELTMTNERTETEEEDANQSSDNRGFGFSLSKMFGLGHWQSAEEDGQTSASINDEDQESQQRGQEDYGTKWNIQDMDAAGMDSSILSKLALVQQNNPLNSAGDHEAVGQTSGGREDDKQAAELRELKDMANSITEWKDDVPRPEPTSYPEEMPPVNNQGEQTDKTQNPGSIQRFFSSLFQPLNFAGTTGDDDENDGGWASVGELDSLNSLVDEVNQMVMPGVNQKMLPHEMTLTQEKQASEGSSVVGDALQSEPSLSVNMVAVPGFENEFFNKYGEVKQDETPDSAIPHSSLNTDELPEGLNVAETASDFFNRLFQTGNAPAEVPPAVPESAAGAAVPAAEGSQSDTLEVPSIPGLTDDFFDKYIKSSDLNKASETQPEMSVNSPDGVGAAAVSAGAIQVPNIPGLTDAFFEKYGGKTGDTEDLPEKQQAEAIQVPNIPGLTDDFFSKYGGAQKPDETESRDIVARDLEDPEAAFISADFFNKFIHPVAQGHAPPEVSAESLQGVPGLPTDFFNKFLRGQQSKVDGVGYEEAPGEVPDLSGLEDYFNKYIEESDLLPGEKVGVESLSESLRKAQLQVPGLPEKVIPEDIPGIAPDLPDVPPSEYPELDEETPRSGVLSYLLSRILGTKKQQFGEGLPVLPPGFNMSVPDAEVPPEIPGEEAANETEQGFRVRLPGQEELELQKMLIALVPNVSSSNDSLHVDDARGLLSQLEGVMPATPGGLTEEKGNMSEKLANITSLEENRVVECNLTKSPLWKVAITDRWHTVKDGLMFVYSAYLDDRILGHTAIRILGILEGWEVGMHLKPYCQVWFQDKAKPFVIGATYEWLPGQPIAKFKAVLLTCVYQTSRVDGKPLAVSLTTEPCEQPTFLVKIHTRNETVGVRKTNFTICLTGPMKFGYADVGQFIQWMEFNIMMGVERFVLYNHSMDAALRPYLVHYARLGYVQLFPWIIPDNIPNPLVFLKNLGHLAMINDCLYRNMWTSRYVIFMDIDEMVIPRYGRVTFEPMLRNAGCHRKPQAIVQSVFFRREWPNDELYDNNQTVLNMGLVGLLKTKREKKIWPPYMRSKYFIKPDEVLICNVHAAHTFLSPLDYQDLSCIFNPKEVILHHYRYWGEVTGNYVVDRRLHEYADELITRAAAVYETVLGRKIT